MRNFVRFWKTFSRSSSNREVLHFGALATSADLAAASSDAARARELGLGDRAVSGKRQDSHKKNSTCETQSNAVASEREDLKLLKKEVTRVAGTFRGISRQKKSKKESTVCGIRTRARRPVP